MNYATNGVRDAADARVIMPSPHHRPSSTRRDGSAPRPVISRAQGAGRKRVAPRFRQRDLSKIMKAAKAAGMASFELVDVETGFILRASTVSELPATTDDLDSELERFVERAGG